MNFINLIANNIHRTAYQYSFVGPLSMSKGCDFAMPLYRYNLDETQDISPLHDYAYRGVGKTVYRQKVFIFLTRRREPRGGDGRHVLHGLDS